MLKKGMNRTQIATSLVRGSKEFPTIKGSVIFKQRPNGVLVTAEIYGLPYTKDVCQGSIFALHIHEGKSCTGTPEDPFANTGKHFNPQNCDHPYHAGDLPPLFGNNGYAYMSVFTNRFKVQDIIGRTVIIHDKPDDFHTQPSGNAGKKIACGKIQ